MDPHIYMLILLISWVISFFHYVLLFVMRNTKLCNNHFRPNPSQIVPSVFSTHSSFELLTQISIVSLHQKPIWKSLLLYNWFFVYLHEPVYLFIFFHFLLSINIYQFCSFNFSKTIENFCTWVSTPTPIYTNCIHRDLRFLLIW